MRECLIERYGETVKVAGKNISYWPAAESIASLDAREIGKKCMLGYRAKAVHAVARSVAAGFPGIVELSRMDDDEMMKRLSSLYGIGSYSAQLISPHRGFPLDSWSARIFFEILFGETPPDSRSTISELEQEAERRWGRYKQYVFVYVLNDLTNLMANYPITKLT